MDFSAKNGCSFVVNLRKINVLGDILVTWICQRILYISQNEIKALVSLKEKLYV
jgi:hypothetical protein